MIKKIKRELCDMVGLRVCVVMKGSRNRRDEYFGNVEGILPNLFSIKLDDGMVKSFSYADVLTGNVEINVK